MANQPLVSIITVVYNGEQYLQQTIDSVINQTYSNIEYIIIDGGSTDKTLDIIRSNNAHISFWISEPDEGLYDAMNKGISYAKGELIGIINSDDWFENDAIRTIAEAYVQHPEKLVFHGDRYDIKSNSEKRLYRYNPSKFKFKYFAMTYNHPSMFFHKSVYKSYQYNKTLSVLSDYELVLKVFLSHPDCFHYIPKAYVNYRLEGISAQMASIKYLKEGFQARINAGLNIFQAILYVILRSVFYLARPLINKLK